MLKKFFGEIRSLDLSEKLLLALVFVLPFERIPSVDVGGLTIKLSLLFGLALIFLNLPKTLKSFKGMNHFIRLPRVLLEISLLSVLWVDNFGYWFKANLVLGFSVALFYTVICLFKNSKNKEVVTGLILKTVLTSAVVIMAFGYFQWFGNLLGLPDYLTAIRPEYTADKLGLPRMHSVLLEPLYFGLYLLLPLGILWADRKGVIFKNLYVRFGLIALVYCSILLSLARGAIVASALLGLLGLIYNFKELKESLRLKDIAKVVAAGLAGMALLVVATSFLGVDGTDEDHDYGRGFSTIVGHLETIKPWGDKEDAADQNSISSRDASRSEAWDVITENKRNLLVGVGAGQYGANLEQAKGLEATSNFVLLDVWAEYGPVGPILLLAFIGYLLLSAFKSKGSVLSDPERVLVIGVGIYLIGFLVQSITFGELAITHLWVGVAFLTAATIGNLSSRP
jgi:O-Antigen ligase